MNARHISKTILFRPIKKAVTPGRRPPVDRPVLRAAWHVSAETGRLECAWADASASDIPYSRAA